MNMIETLEDAKSVVKSIIYDNLQLRLESNGVVNVLTGLATKKDNHANIELVELEDGRVRFSTFLTEAHCVNYLLEHKDIVNVIIEKWNRDRHKARKNYIVLYDVLSSGDIGMLLHFISANNVHLMFTLGGKRVFISKNGEYDYVVLDNERRKFNMSYFKLLDWFTQYKKDVLTSLSMVMQRYREVEETHLSPFRLYKLIATGRPQELANYIVDNKVALDYESINSRIVIVPFEDKTSRLVRVLYYENGVMQEEREPTLVDSLISPLSARRMPFCLGVDNFKRPKDYKDMDKPVGVEERVIIPLVKSRGGGAKDGEFRLMYANDLNNSIGMAGFPTGLKYKNVTLCLGDVITFLDNSGREQTGIIHMKRNLITVSSSGDTPLSQVRVLGVVSRWKDAGNVLDVNGQRILFETLIR